MNRSFSKIAPGVRSGMLLSIILFALLGISFQANSQRFSVANGDWNNTATWSATSGGAPGASVPVAGDAVTIERNFTVNITADAACASLQLGGLTANQPGSITFAAGTINLVVTGSIQVGGSGNANRDGVITFQAGSTISTASLNLGGTLATPGQGTIIMTAGGILNVTGAVTVTGAGNTFTRGVGLVQLSGTNTLVAPFNAFNNLNINGGATSLGANATVIGALNVTAGSFNANAFTNTVTALTSVSGGTYLASTALQTFNGGLTISGGTFTGATGGVTTTNITLSSGTLTAPSGTFNVSGNWTNDGGAFLPGANTVTFNLGAAQAINGTAATQTFNNITIAKTAGTMLTVSGSTTTLNVAAFTQTTGNFTAPANFNATGALTLTAGTFTAGGSTNLDGDFVNNGGTFTAGTNTVTFGGSGAKTISGSAATIANFYNVVITSGSVLFGNLNATRALNISNNLTINGGSFLSGNTGVGAYTINLTGNLQNDGAIDFSANGATNHRLILLGTAKTISGSGTNTFQSLRLNTTASANVNLNSSVRVNGTLDWTAAGLLVLGGSDFTFGSAAVVTAPGATQYIQSDGTVALTGQVIRINSGNETDWEFLFPIGTATGGYSPLNLTGATVVTTAPTSLSTLAVKALVSADAPGRLKRTFRMTVAGNLNATTLTGARFNYYNPTDVSGLEPIASYTSLWYQRESTGVWTSIAGTVPGTVNAAPTLSFFTGPTAAQPLTNDTYFFTIGTPSAFGQTWYSYQTGNWSNPLSWTTDGSSFPLYINPTNAIPGVADNVVITSGKTISMDVNTQQVVSMNVIGTLDILATTGHNFGTISGSGRIKIAGVTDNFPAGTATNFADSAVGGTLEINGSGILLASPRTFNNVVVSMSTTSNVAVLKNNWTMNGNLTITQGLLQFEDLTVPANRTLAVTGNVTVASNGGIRTANSNNRHEFNLFGDFVNNGTAYFTNRTVANTTAEATDGIVDVNFLSATRDQQAVCNGETRFYRLEINKGSDATYKVSLSASSSSNFNLFGFAQEGHPNVLQLAVNNNALGLAYGTIEIGANVTIPTLQTNGYTGNYNVSVGATLWVNGGSVTWVGDASGNGALVPYGKVRVSAGSLTVDVGSGLTLRDDGIVQVEGGTLTSRVIRTSVVGVGAVGTYLQSGGNVVLTGGGGISAAYAVFSLTYPGNVFNMSGGTLTIQNRTTTGTGGLRGAIFINSDPANVSITGGAIIMDANTGINYRITSRVPFWNVILRANGGVRTLELLGTTSGTGGGAAEPSVSIQPLVVLNDFTIQGTPNATFNTNNADVSIGGNFEIQNGGTYTHGTNTTTISGAGVGSLIFGNTAATQTFNNLTINKTNATDEVAIATGRPGPTNAALQVNGILNVVRGVFDYSSFVASAQGTVTFGSGVTVGKSTSTGRLLLNGPAAQTINSSLANIHNLELSNSSNVTLATNNLTILRTLTLTAGNFNIGTFKLTLNGASAAIAGSGFSATKMIQTAANNSDGGLEMYLDANETLTYPIGVAGKYTPVTAAFTSFADDGLVNVIPTNGVLQTTNLAGGTSILGYYWKVKHSNFTALPIVSYQFEYVTGDVAGTEALYVPGKVLDQSPFTRSSENDVTKVDDATNRITFNGSGSGFALELANYTAGEPNRFTGVPEVYYTRVFGDGNNIAWNNAANWTLGTNVALGKHDSAQPAAPSFPQAGDIAIVGYVPLTESVLPVANHGKPHGIAINNNVTVDVAELRFEQMKDALNNPTARNYAYNFQFRPTVVINNTGTQGRIINAKVSGEGMFWIRSSSTLANLSDPTFATVDLGAFNLQDSSYVVYENNVNGASYLNMPSTFPNLMMATNGWGNQNHDTTIPNNITVNGDLELLGNINLVLATGATGDITVRRNLRFFRSVAINDSGEGSELRFGNTGTPRTVTVFGNLLLGNQVSGQNTAAVIRVLTPGTTPITHTFNLYGNFIQTTRTAGNGFKAGTSATQDRIHVNLLGATSMTLTNNGGDAPQFYSLTVNKGTSISTTAQFNSLFTIDGPSDQATKSLTLLNGLFIINSASTITLTSGGGDFNIPGTAGLEVRAGTARTTTTSTNANITLDGLLRVSGGIVDINGGGATDTNYIQYSNSGNSAIEVTAGTLTVAGQIRRDLTSASGVLKYTQSGGTVLVGNEAAPTNTRGVFEVLNPGSQFNHSGGSFTIVRGQGSATVSSLWLDPAIASITPGSTITLGNGSTPVGTIGIQSSVPLNNLAVAGLAASTPQVSLYVTPLTVNGNITVAASNTLNALGRDLTIGGNFTVNGTYTSGNNTTTFNNAGGATIGGAVSALSFNNFTKTGAGQLDLARDITVNRDLKASAGILNTATFAINLLRHAEVDATIASTSGNGLVFGSTVQQQQLTRSVSGTGSLGIVTINNSNGVIVPDGNGYDFSIATNLRMQSGIFDIGGGLLSLGVSALIIPVTPYSATNLIQTNSSFTDKGVRKQFPTNYTTDFIFPVGQSNYTPVTFTFSGGNTTGSSGTPTITVRPSNRRHPVIIDDNGVGELPDPATFNDLNNVLQYYWIVGATGVASDFRSNMALQYTQPLVSVVNPYAETDYIAARILTDLTVNPLLNISKFSTTEVNETTNVINFSFASVTDGRNITGDYFAGIPVAIPDNVTTYTTVASGNVNAAIYDTPVFGGVPNGARVIVSPGHSLNFNVNSVILYQTVINAGAKVVIPDGSIGHSLGVLSGTGDLEINSNTASAVLPAALYDNFFSCAGGGLIFGGSGSYEILGGITALRNLTLDGSGDKTMANNDLTICNDFTLNSGAFFNSTSRDIIVQNDVLLNGGSYNNVGGTLTITRDLTQISGVFEGGTGGTKLISRNLSVNGGAFNPGSGTSNVIRVNGNMTVAGGATITTGGGGVTGQRFTFGGSSAQVLTGDFTNLRAFNRLEINNSSGLTLVGDATINNELQLTNGLITPGSSRFLLTGTAVVAPVPGSATSFVNGKLFKTITTAGSTFVFPIGKASRWRSGTLVLSVGAINAGQTWDMEYFAGAATGVVVSAPAPRNNPVSNFTSADPLVLRMSSGEYWRVSDGSATANGRSARVGLSWGIESDVSANLAQREAMTIMSWNGTNWTNNGGTNFQPGGTHTQTRGTFESTATLSFSENIVILGSTEIANPLPVTLVKFEGRIDGSIASLNWKTASEINNDYFEIQRSPDGLEFVEVGKVNGNGTTNLPSEYFFEDRNLLKGNNYYRLKQFDFDGKSSYSDVIVLDYDGSTPLNIFLYPNPTNSQNVNLELINPTSENVSIRILDIIGRPSFQAIVKTEEIESNISLKTEELKSGVYVVEVTQGTQRVTKRLVIQN